MLRNELRNEKRMGKAMEKGDWIVCKECWQEADNRNKKEEEKVKRVNAW